MVAEKKKIGKAEAFGEEELRVTMCCPTCRGTGVATQQISFEILGRISAQYDNKISRIKEVRTIWGLGLRSAKELVEAYDKHREEVQRLERLVVLSVDEASAKLLKELTEIDYS